MIDRNRRVLTLMVGLLVLAVPFTVAVADDEQVEETDAIVPFVIIAAGYGVKALVASFIGGAIVGGALVAAVNQDTGPDEDETRRVEAQLMAQALMTGVPLYVNSMENYANIWALTGEHWVRQAEISAASAWSIGAEYDANLIMDTSRIYYNDAIMMANATNQFNEQMTLMNEHVGEWNDSEVAQYYGDGKMKLQFEFWNDSVTASSDDRFTARMGTVIRDVGAGNNAVYYAGGPVYVDKAATLTGSKGNVENLNAGWNWIEDPDTYQYADIYTVQARDGGTVTIFSSSMTSVVTTDEYRSASPQVALAVTCGDDVMIVSYDRSTSTLTNGSVTRPAYSDGVANGLKICILADGNEPVEQDITDILIQYANLQSAISITQTRANTSAMAVWSIYNDAGSASAYLTTLMVPDTYQNITFNEAQKRVITILAMDQLAEYWNAYGGDVKTSEYRMTLDSMSLYCRGSVSIPGTDGSSEKYYDDVIYTPIFYQDQSLRSGMTNTIDQNGFIVVWGDGRSLSNYDGSYSNDELDLIFVDSGAELGITEMRNGNEMISDITLDAAEVDWIDAQEMEDFDPYDPDYSDLGELIRLIFILIGAGILIYGAYNRSIPWILVGAAVILVGFVFADTIAGLFNDLWGWSWFWPF